MPLPLMLLYVSLWCEGILIYTQGVKATSTSTFTLGDREPMSANNNVKNIQSGNGRWQMSYERMIIDKDDGRAHTTRGKTYLNSARTSSNNSNSTSHSLKRVLSGGTKQKGFSKLSGAGRFRLEKDREAWLTEEKLKIHGNAVRKTHDQGGNLKPHARQKQEGNLNKKHQRICRHNNQTISRQRREAKYIRRSSKVDSLISNTSLSMWESLPQALAQEQSTDFPFNDTSDYEQFTSHDLQDSTPFVPINTRTRRKDVRNPFYPVTAESYGAYAIMIFSALIFTVGILGNISIMCIVCHNYYMRSISNSLLANLAVWDFVVIFFCLPLVIFHELTKNWLLGEFSCKIIPYIEVASLGVTTFTLCALCIDRFRAATNVQMYYEMVENCASTAAKLAVIWIGALLLALPELLIRQLVTEDGDPPDVIPCQRCVVRISTELPDTLYVLGLTYNGARLWWYFGCYFCLPTLFTIGSSLVTARKIRQAERSCVRGNKKQIQLESQMNCTVVALAILYGFCIIPENICNVLNVYMAAGIPGRTLDILQLVSQLFLFCKSAVTPVLLFCLCQPFSRAFLDCCCCCCDECGPTGSGAATSASNNDNDPEGTTTDLELSPFSTMRRDPSPYAVGTHC